MKSFEVNGVRMAVDDVGSGPPVLFVHGFPLTRAMWHAQVEDLASDYRVIAPDLRGFGQSAAASVRVTMDQYADDLAALLVALAVREPVTLAGLSMGGYIAHSFWKRHVERLAALILLDTKAEADTPAAAAGRRESAATVEAVGTDALIASLMDKLLASSTPVAQPVVAERVHAIMASNGPTGVSAALRGMAEREDWTGDLGRINLPSLIIVGSEDAISPPGQMRRMADALPQADYVEIPHAGHLTPLENPRAVNAAIREFLARLA